MKASFYTESVLYWLARALSAAACRLPARWCAAFGAAVGTLIFVLLPKRGGVALSNLRAAFQDAYTPREYRKILRAMFQHMGMQLMEVARIPAVDRAYIDRWVEIAPGSRERLERALGKGKGVIFLTGHFGNWELIPLVGALHGFPTMVLAREQGWPRLNRLLTSYRESKGCKVVTKGFPIREMIRGLGQGRIVGILSDQDGGRNGILAPFFGRLASTAPGALALSLSTGAPVLPVFMTRKRGPAHRMTVEEPLEIPAEGPMEDRIQAGISGYLRILEKYVQRHPHQWLWLHRRWKSSPQRRLLLFSDGKAGHDSQLAAFAEAAAEGWRARVRDDNRLRGRTEGLLTAETVRIAYRHPLWRPVLALVASVAPPKFRGGDLWLRLALSPESYRKIRSLHADASVSCGSHTAPVNLLWAWAAGAKPMHVNRSWPSWRRFHCAVVPRHDGPPSPAPEKLFVVDGALTPQRRTDAAQLAAWGRALGSRKEKKIGLLLGGPARGVTLELNDVKQLIAGLLEACTRLDAELLVTSSRRTPPAVENWLKETLAADPRCRLLALVNRREPGPLETTAAAVPCILSLSDTLVVSGDSISMVSEAVSGAKPVVSFLPTPARPGGREPKYHRFLDGLGRQGLITVAQPGQVGEAVVQTFGNGDAPVQPVPTNGTLAGFIARWL